MKPLNKNIKIGVAGIGVLGAVYLASTSFGGDDSGGGGQTGFFKAMPLGDEVGADGMKKIASLPEPDFTGLGALPKPFTETVKETSIIPSIKDYDSWRESIKRPEPVKKEKIVATQKTTTTPAKINPFLDAFLSVTDPTLPIAATAAKLTVDKYVPAKKESIAKAKEIPVSNLSTVLAKSKSEKKGFFSTLFSLLGSDAVKKSPATGRQKTIALETAGETVLFGHGAAINMVKAAGVKTPATKKQKTGALQTTAYTAAFGHGAGIASAINSAFNMPSIRKPVFSATAARYGGAAAGYGKYGKGYTTTKKGGAIVTKGSSGWTGGSTRDRMNVATQAGVHGLSYR